MSQFLHIFYTYYTYINWYTQHVLLCSEGLYIQCRSVSPPAGALLIETFKTQEMAIQQITHAQYSAL